MSTNINSTVPDTGKRHLTISLLLLGGLLFLRFPFLITVGIVSPNKSASRTVAMIIFAGGTYLFTALLIWWERKQLHDFWIDLASAITFLCQIFCFPIGIGLFWAMRQRRARFPAAPTGVWRWSLLGAILALASNLLLVSLGVLPSQPRSASLAGATFLVPAILVQMTNAAVWEEPLFRGFLWGYLRRWRWPNALIWLLQAALFTLGHVYYLKDEAFVPWLIRLMLPSLVIGLMAWRAGSIFASMVTHGVFNASVDMLLHTRSLSEAINVCWSAAAITMALLAAVWMMEWLRPRYRFRRHREN